MQSKVVVVVDNALAKSAVDVRGVVKLKRISFQMEAPQTETHPKQFSSNRCEHVDISPSPMVHFYVIAQSHIEYISTSPPYYAAPCMKTKIHRDNLDRPLRAA